MLDHQINVEELVLESSKRRRVLDLDRFMETKSVMNGSKSQRIGLSTEEIMVLADQLVVMEID